LPPTSNQSCFTGGWSEPSAVVDSSGWIEVFTDGPQAQRFVSVLDSGVGLVVLTVSLLEVFKWVSCEHSEAQAIQAIAAMQNALVVDLDARLALAAAQLTQTLRLPMAGYV
jgi:uncharacterized protein with PIN domain